MNQGSNDAPKKQTLAEYPVLRADNLHAGQQDQEEGLHEEQSV